MISINIYEIVFQCINFAILLFVLKRFLTKPLSTFLKSRAESIRTNITESEANRTESERILFEQKELLKKAHQESKEIREKAEVSAKKERETVIKQSKEDAHQIIENAKKEIDRDVEKAKTALTNQVSNLSISISEKILKTSINKEQHAPIIQDYLERMKN